mmetsp:Transcript_44386/g.113365  ORF Transcript_44386/g.113365 Transcript_44386/m.113365 type:complete len:93 (-) Transcript_44386:1830-2108(-)
MADAEAETKPDAVQISLKVRNSDGKEVLFKVRTTTKFEKIFDAYCQKNAIGANVTRFLFDGLRVKKEDTPASDCSCSGRLVPSCPQGRRRMG